MQVDSTDFLVKSDSMDKCTVPNFGTDVCVKFCPTKKDLGKSRLPDSVELVPISYSLTMEGGTETDFGWVCAKLFECCTPSSDSIDAPSSFDGLDISDLRRAVAKHFNGLPPHPGYDASNTAGSDIKVLLSNEQMRNLEKNGYTVIDTAPKTSRFSNDMLSDFLLEKTGQDRSVRTDTVAFLDKEDAIRCGLSEHFDLLMSVASHMNDYLEFQPSPFPPIFPGTEESPLTNPRHIQAAEYGHTDFYKAHR